VDNRLWSDHTSIQPTMMAALRLRDDFRPDGRVLTELLAAGALPASARAHRGLLLRLGRAYTAINAPVGPFGLATLRASTRALASASPGDHVYTMTERRLGRLGRERDQVAGAMRRLLLGADFGGRPIQPGLATSLIRIAHVLLRAADKLAA